MNIQICMYYSLFNEYSNIHWLLNEHSINIPIFIDYYTKDLQNLKIQYALIIQLLFMWLFIDYSSKMNIHFIGIFNEYSKKHVLYIIHWLLV